MWSLIASDQIALPLPLVTRLVSRRNLGPILSGPLFGFRPLSSLILLSTKVITVPHRVI